MSTQKSEHWVWAMMRDNCSGYGQFDRVESIETSAGIPDVDFCITGSEGHIELKYGEDNKPPKMRPTQTRWFKKRVRNGGKPWLLALIIIDGVDYWCLYCAEEVCNLHTAKSNFDWIRRATYKWTGKMNWDELIKFIRS